MARGDLPALVGLDVADPPERWRGLGFSLTDDGAAQIGTVHIRFGSRSGAGRGLTGWTLAAAQVPPDLDGIPTTRAASARAVAAEHPNGAVRIDHVVVATPDLDRTLRALSETGLKVSRVRETGQEGPRARQAFLWAGDVILEVVGPDRPAAGGPAVLWGLVVVTTAMQRLVETTGGLVGEIRPAVQPGRMIASVQRDAGLSVPLAFMSPHEPAADGL